MTGPPRPWPCLTGEDIGRYLGDAPTGDRTELERHVEGCERCRRTVALAVRDRRALAGADGAGGARRVTTAHEPPTARRAYTIATLRDEEIRSARTMLRMGRVLGLVALLPVPLLHGVAAVQLVFVASAVSAIASGLVVEHQIEKPERYSETKMMVMAVQVVVAGLLGMFYYGIFSAAQLFPILMIYAFARRERLGNTILIYLMTAVGQGLLAGLVISELVPDPGLFEPQVPTTYQITGHILIQLGDLTAFVVGWYSRRDTQAAIDNLQNAMLLATKRAVLLQEARDELDRALRVGGGRYTDHVFGGYRLGNLLGRGGMGEVYEAQHLERGEPAAVKLLPPRELGNPRSVQRFVREVRTIRALGSRHVVRVLGASDEDDPVPYLAMERLSGQTLAQLLRGTPPTDLLLDMIAQIGDALEEAWSHGIVHRDLKPHNVFYTDDRVWKVLDFGVAALADHGTTLTDGHVIGTPAYMAPEQARGERVDHRADLYAVAAIAYRWLTGQPVASGDDARATLYRVVHAAPMRPSALAPLPTDVDAVLAIALAKAPADRWDRIAELHAALAAALAGELDATLRRRAAELVARQPWG